MKWVFPMAGRGTRTSSLGAFKPFVKVAGRRMLEWMLASIAPDIGKDDSLIFITTNEFAEAYTVQRNLEEILPAGGIDSSFSIVRTDGTPPGPSATVHSARAHLLCCNEPVIVVNCDQYIDFDLCDMSAGRCGFLPVYASFGEKSSFVEVESGVITRIVEKQNISNLASAGVYAISEGSALLYAIETQFRLDQRTNGEFYVGVALNNLIAEGYTFYPTAVRAKYDLGSIVGIHSFEQSIESLSQRQHGKV
jgi:NDP-sugar pyrophosphorylase family protein